MARVPTRLDRWEAGARGRVPGPVVFLLFGELRLLEALWQRATGRWDVRSGESAIGYAHGRLAAELVFASVAVIELLAVDIFVPWDRLGGASWIRFAVLIASLYGVLWIALWMTAERTRPHLLTDDALVLRWGHLVIAEVPWLLIDSVRVHARYTDDEERLTHDVPLQGTNLDIELREPFAAAMPFRRPRTVTGISLGVDAPEAARDLIEARIVPGRPADPPAPPE